MLRLRQDASDEAAWTDLVYRLWPYLLSVAARAMGKRHPLAEAEDIAQEVLLNLARVWPVVRLDSGEALRKVVAAFTHHRVVDWARRMLSQRRDIRRSRSLGEASDVAAAPLHLARPGETMEFEAILNVLAEDEMDRKILVCLHEGWQQVDIAKQVGVDPATVSRRAKRLGSLLPAAQHQALQGG